MTALWILGALAVLLIAFGPVLERIRPVPPHLKILSGTCGGLLALATVLLYPGIWPGFWPSLLTVSLYLVSLYLRWRWLWLLAPVILALLILRTYLGLAAAPELLATEDTLEVLHLLLWAVATAAVWLATMQAALLLYQHRRLKRGQPLSVGVGLPLDEMSRILTALASASLALVTFALAYSWWWEQFLTETPIHLAKYILAGGAWALLAGLLISYWLFGLRGYRLVGWMFGVLGTLALSLAWSISLD